MFTTHEINIAIVIIYHESVSREFSDILEPIEDKVVESSLASGPFNFIQSGSCTRHISNGFVYTNLFIRTLGSENYHKGSTLFRVFE